MFAAASMPPAPSVLRELRAFTFAVIRAARCRRVLAAGALLPWALIGAGILPA